MKLVIEVDIKDGRTCRGCTYDLVVEMMRAMKDADKNIQAYGHFPFGHPELDPIPLVDGRTLLMESKPPINAGELTAEAIEALPVVSRAYLLAEDFDTTRQSVDTDCETVAFDRNAGTNVELETVVAQSERSN